MENSSFPTGKGVEIVLSDFTAEDDQPNDGYSKAEFFKRKTVVKLS
jgi:hypothetical protein